MTRGLFDAASAGRTILAPTAELAAALFDLVQRMHVEAGDAVWPTPRIRDFGGWLKDCYAERQFSDAGLPRLLSDIEERELWRGVILESAGAAEFLEPNGAARSARRAHRAMAEYGIPVSALLEYGTEESLALLGWRRRFDERCRELGRIASDRLLESEAANPPDLVWIESPIWRPVARRWLQQHAAAPLLPMHGAAEAIVRRCRAASPQIELAAMAEWARDNLRTEPRYRAWICVPDLSVRRAELLDAFDAALAPQRFSMSAGDTAAPYAVAGGTPLADYPPVQAALTSLAAAVGTLPFPEFSSLLRMPELQSSPDDASAAASLDVALRRCAPDAAPLPEWLKMAEPLSQRPVAALRRLEEFLTILRAVSGAHPLSRWISVWVDALECGPWALRQRWSSAEFQSAERFRELLAALATADDVFGSQSAAAAGRILNRAARDTAFQPQTGIPSIWVSAQVMDPWLRYDGLWIGGCAEERWPPPLDPIPLLPVRLQRDFGVVSAGADLQLQFAADLQRRWQARARDCVFSCADAGDGRPRTFSPLVPEGAPAASQNAVPRPHWRALMQRAPRLETLLDESAPAFAPGENTRGVATLRAQSQCAFRGFAETRLDAGKLTRPIPGFNQRERGEMLHDALEQLWSDLRTSERLAAIGRERLGGLVQVCVSRAIARQCRRRDPGALWQHREAPRLQALLHKWLQIELGREPFEVEQLEQEAQSARHGGIEFRVRIDRIDKLADGGRVLIDYKTGQVSADWRGDRPENPQLPIYALLRPADLVAVAYGQVNAGQCGFVAEAARADIFKRQGRKSALEGMADFASLVGLWSRRIEKIAAEFAAGVAQVAPLPGACKYCGLQRLCRVPAGLDGDVDEDPNEEPDEDETPHD